MSEQTERFEAVIESENGGETGGHWVNVPDAAAVAAGPAPREVKIPPDLEAALRTDARASEAYHRLSYTHRNEYVRWITEAKRDATLVRERCLDCRQGRPGRTSVMLHRPDRSAACAWSTSR